MRDRVYVIPEGREGKPARVVSILRGKNDVVMADILEATGNVMMVEEASERYRLAELTVQALISIEAMTDEIQLLPVNIGDDIDFIARSSPARSLV